MNTALHSQRLERARLALDGLSVGDAFGERFFVNPSIVDRLIDERAVPREPWRYTDDTEMGLGIVETLELHGGIDQDHLAQVFARRYAHDMQRGYGGGAHMILGAISNGAPWREAAGSVFEGLGSMGNGGAMRVAPIGGYFADDLDAAILHARRSAEVTHAHPDGQAGAIAVAVAAVYAHRWAQGDRDVRETRLVEWVLPHVPRGETRDAIDGVRGIALTDAPREVALRIGSGARVLSWDTVPFTLWCAERHLDHFEEAMWTTVAGLGDRDTTCAIVGGIVALSTGRDAIPSAWIAARERLA